MFDIKTATPVNCEWSALQIVDYDQLPEFNKLYPNRIRLIPPECYEEWCSSTQGTPIGLNDWILWQEHKLGVLVYTDEVFQNIMRIID